MMKYVFTLLGVIAMLFSMEAQVSEKTKTMSLGTQNAIIVSIPDADKKLIEKQWKAYLKEYGKVKKNRKTKEHFADDVKIASISGAGTMDVYATSEDGQLISYFDMGNGFLSSESHSDSYKAASVFLNEFKNEVTREMIRQELKEEEKNLGKMEKTLKGLEKDLDRYNSIIEKAKERIAQAEADIEQNGIDQENTKVEIESQTKVVEEVQEKLEKVGK